MGAQRCPGGRHGGDPLTDLCHALCVLALQGQRPSTYARSVGCPEGKSLLGRERDSGLCLRMHGRHVAAKLRDEGRHTLRPRQTKGMRQRVRQRQGLVDMSQGLIRVPEQPEGPGGIGSAGNTRVLAHAEHWRTALVWRIACAAFLQVRRAAGNAPRLSCGAPRAVWATTASAGSSAGCARRSNVSPSSRAVCTCDRTP